MTNAPITPGIHPQSVNKKMMKNEPHPLSMTDKGGKIIANKTRKKTHKYSIISNLYMTYVFTFCYNIL